MNSRIINWFEIPVTDINRATAFYQTILSTTLTPMEMGDITLAMFPAENQTGGALVQGEGYTPSQEGCIVYLNSDSGMEAILKRIPEMKGNVVMPKTSIDEFGFMARFIDSEGNLLALHSAS